MYSDAASHELRDSKHGERAKEPTLRQDFPFAGFAAMTGWDLIS